VSQLQEKKVQSSCNADIQAFEGRFIATAAAAMAAVRQRRRRRHRSARQGLFGGSGAVPNVLRAPAR